MTLTKEHAIDLFNAIAHGDTAHRTWLREALLAWCAGKELPEYIPSLHPPIKMRLHCPSCNTLHIDKGEFETKPHHTHACQSCGMVWRPAIEPTVGVQFLPGFKDV